jgi:hypothetical protein
MRECGEGKDMITARVTGVDRDARAKANCLLYSRHCRLFMVLHLPLVSRNQRSRCPSGVSTVSTSAANI